MSWLSSGWKKLTGRSITQTVQAAAPVAGTIFGGPIGGAIGGAVAAGIGGGVTSVPPPRVQAAPRQYVTLPSAGPVQVKAAGLAPIIGRVATSPTVRGAVTGAIAGAGIDFLTGRPVRRKYRRMNYGNMKAARRAIRRIKGARKMLQEIERQLPKKTVRSRTPARRYGPHTHG